MTCKGVDVMKDKELKGNPTKVSVFEGQRVKDESKLPSSSKVSFRPSDVEDPHTLGGTSDTIYLQ